MFTTIHDNPAPTYVDPSLRAPFALHPLRMLRRAAAAMTSRRSSPPPAATATDINRMRADFEARFTL